ncbi:MAG: PAS domain-containing sensor histidine kinase [Calditrichales bacterium]|nr:MAG: PAS domain-containing sensor histidine kinase [Calditrichales bacterium]
MIEYLQHKLIDQNMNKAISAYRKQTDVKDIDLFRSLLNSIGEAIIGFDSNRNIFLANLSAEKMFDLQAEKLIGKSLKDLISPAFWDQHRTEINRYFSQAQVEDNAGNLAEYQGIRSDGEIFPMEVSIRVDRSGPNEYLLAILRDVSRKRRTEAAIRSSEDRYRSLQENLPLGIYQATPEGKIVAVNNAILNIMGYENRFEIIQIPLYKFFLNQDDYKKIIHRLRNVQALTDFDVQLIKKDGSTIWTSLSIKASRDESGKVKYINGIVIDISESKAVEQALIESETKYRQLAETAQDIIIMYNGSARILYANQATLKCLKYKNDQVIGKLITDIVAPEHHMAWAEHQEICRGSAREFIPYEVELVNNEGAHIPFEVNTSMIEGNSGQETWFIYARDLSARKKLEDQLHQSQKMDSIGTLAGGIAHDFNNLLTIINGLSEITLRKMDEDNPNFRDIKSIHLAGKKAEDLTRKLLAFSRKQIIHPKIIDTNALISDLDKMLRRLIREDILIEKNLFPRALHIKADPGQFEQILINLVVNARDAIGEHHSRRQKIIGIATHPEIVDESYLKKSPDIRLGSYVMISVTDTGIGMENETIDKIFEPFFTTKEKGHGTGLGMSTVYGIVKQNKGFIKVNSQLGVGTGIEIYWPSVDDELPEDIPYLESIQEDKNLHGAENILVVEDDKDVRYFTSFALKNLGYNVYEADSGLAALTMIQSGDKSKTNSNTYDMVITDLIMPGMNGKELAQNLSKFFPKIKVLFTSGYNEEYIVKHEMMPEETKFIQKPFTVNILAEKVRSILDAD